MAKSISLLDIVKSRYGSNENLPKWREKRLSICSSCPLNSDNKPKEDWTPKEKAWVAANHGKSTCLACKCMLEAKTKIPHAVCGLKSKGKEPLWHPVKTIKENSNIKVENMSTTDVEVYEEDYEIWIKYPTLKQGEETDVQLLITDVKDNMENISAESSCGCTVPEIKKENKEIVLTIVYNTKLTGSFTKTVILSYTQNKIDYQRVFKITGQII